MKTPAIALLILFTLLLQIQTANAGYFLSWPQKGELLITGGVTDSAGNSYNVTIIPGYLSMLDFTGASWMKGVNLQKKGGLRLAKGLLRVPLSFKNFRDYFTPQPWDGIADGFNGFCDGEHFLLTDYMWSGVGSTWKEYFGLAAAAHARKSFGWWFTYPWATIKGTVNTTLRYATGIPATALVLSYGFCLRPVWELTLPLLKTGKDVVVNTADASYGVLQSSWGLAVNQVLLGVATPVSGYAWTTAVGVPMSLLGRAPTPQSADGWWVVMTYKVPEKRVIVFPDSAAIFAVVKDAERQVNYEALSDSIRREQYRVLAPFATELAQLQERMDSLHAIVRATTRQYDLALQNSTGSTQPSIDYPPRPAGTVDDGWQQQEVDSLREYLRAAVLKSVNGAVLSPERQSRLVEDLIVYWTSGSSGHRYYQAPAKQYPNRLIQTEMEAIVK